MVWKELIKSVAKFLIGLAFNMIFNAIDKDKDGKLSHDEINEFVDLINNKLKKVK